MSPRAPSACVLGLGLMGRPIARSLLAAGHDVRGWNRSPLEPALTAPIPLCETIAEAAAADVALLVLTDSDAVDAVLHELEPLLTTGQTVVDMGTSDPARSREHAGWLADAGIGWVDAPSRAVRKAPRAVGSRSWPGERGAPAGESRRS